VKKTSKKNDSQLALNLPDNTKAVVVLCAKQPSATLGEMASTLEKNTRVPRPWPYHVEPTNKKRWCASLAARHASQHAVRRGLIRRMRPGVYRVTVAGLAAVGRKAAA
jgi:hypothetical protein